MTAQMSEASYKAYVDKNARWNFAVNLLDLTFYNLAMSFIFSATVLTLYASYLTDSAVLIGLVPAVQNLMFYLPQLLMSRRAEQLPVKKHLIVKISVVERLPYLFVALSILFLPNAPRWVAFLVLIVSLAMGTGAGGLGAPGWKGMLSKVIPPKRRGLLFGLSSATGSLLGVGGAALSRYILLTYEYPVSYAYCFLLCFACQLVSYTCLLLNREPYKQPEIKRLTAFEYWRRLPGVLRSNRNFARYLGARALATLGTMGTALYVVYAKRQFNIPDTFAAELTMAALISQAVSTPLLGWLADRKGNKWLLQLSSIFHLLGLAVVFVAPTATWLYVVFMLVNAGTAGMSISAMAITMEFSTPDDVPTFAALASTISAGPVLLAPLIGGWLVDNAGMTLPGGASISGFETMFVVATIFLVAGWLMMRWMVREPRHEGPALGIGAGE